MDVLVVVVVVDGERCETDAVEKMEDVGSRVVEGRVAEVVVRRIMYGMA